MGGFLANYQDVEGSLWHEYLAAWYWSMTTLTTVGYGDIIPTSDQERAYAILAMVVGGSFYGYIVGTITSVVAQNDLNSSTYYDRMDLIQAWLDHHHLPQDLRRELRHHFENYLTEKSAAVEADIFHDLTPQLQPQVGEYILHEDIKHNALFDGIPVGAVVRLQCIVKKITVGEGLKVTEAGQAGTAMYVILSGTAHLESERPEVHKSRVLGAGENFGEEIILGLAEHYDYTVTATARLKLEMLLEEEFLNLFQTMPNIIERMRKNACDLHPQWKGWDAQRWQRSSRVSVTQQ